MRDTAAADPRALGAQGCTTFCVLSVFAEWRNVLWAVFCRQLSTAGKPTSNPRLSASLYRHEGERCQKFILHARCYWPGYFIDLIHRINNCHLNEHVTKINVPSCGSVYKLAIDLVGEEKNFKSTMWKENMHKEKELLRPTYYIWILLNDSNTMWRRVRLHSQERHMYHFTISLELNSHALLETGLLCSPYASATLRTHSQRLRSSLKKGWLIGP